MMPNKHWIGDVLQSQATVAMENHHGQPVNHVFFVIYFYVPWLPQQSVNQPESNVIQRLSTSSHRKTIQGLRVRFW